MMVSRDALARCPHSSATGITTELGVTQEPIWISSHSVSRHAVTSSAAAQAGWSRRFFGGDAKAASMSASRVVVNSEAAAPAQVQASASSAWSFSRSRIAASRSDARSAAIHAARSGRRRGSAATLPPLVPAQRLGRRAVELDRIEPIAPVELCDDAVFRARRLGRDHAVADILDHAHRVAIQRIAPTAATGAADDDARFRRDLVPVGVDGFPLILARAQHQPVGLAAILAAPESPGRHAMAAGLGNVPAPGDEVAHFDVEPEPAAELAGAGRIRAQLALLDDDRKALLQGFDRAVAHIALADRAGGRWPIFHRPAAPAAALGALHDEALAGRGIGAEERHIVAHRAF